MTKYILMDIEGTISDIRFVKEVLFPYSAKKLPEFYKENADKMGITENLDTLLTWIHTDVKHPVLKKIQGHIWKEGFESGEFKSHLYEDVIPCWDQWRKKGLKLGIYSSGSIAAQKLFFQYSTFGNVLDYLSHHFDLSTGSKKEVESYQQIAKTLELESSDILFLSDIEAELDAAQSAGFNCVQIVRDDAPSSQTHITADTLSHIPQTLT